MDLTNQDSTRGQLTENSDGTLEAPTEIIRSASAARSLYMMVRQQNLKRIGLWAAIEGLIAGNPPYNQAELDSHGLSYMTNYNDLSARSRFDKEGLMYWNLLNLAEILVKITLEIEDEEAGKWSKIMSINFDKYILKAWPSFTTMMGTHSGQLCKFGLSALIWSDERNWQPRTTELHRFLVPDQTSTDMDQFTYCFLENEFTAQYLYQMYTETVKEMKDDKVSKADREDTNYFKYSWNAENLKALLLNRANSFAKSNNNAIGFVDFFELQKALQNSDWSYGQFFGDSIKLISLLYKEYDGKISHSMFDTVWTGPFLFFNPDQYNDFREVVAVFTVSPEEFTLHSVRGMGHKVFSPCQAKNQLACSMVDMARFSATPMIRNEGGSIREPQQVRLYPGVPTDIGSSEFVENRLGNNLQQVVGVLQYLDGNLSQNLASSGDDAGMPDAMAGSVSPRQAEIESYREFGLPKNRVNHFLGQMDYVYANMLAIIYRSEEGYPGYEYARKFKEACIRQGVPKEIFDIPNNLESGLPDIVSIKASRVAGDGSTLGLMMGLQQLEPILPDLSPKAKNAYIRDRVLVAMGPDSLKEYMVDMDSPDEISGGASLAGAENGLMSLGKQPVFSPSNEHKAHFATHMTLLLQTKQQVQQQQATPIDAQKIFDQALPHTTDHWQSIQKSIFGRSFVEKYKQPWDEIQKYAILNKKNAIKMYEAQIKKQQEAQQQQQEVLSEIELKNLSTQADIERKGKESEAKIARQDKESETRGETKKIQAESDAEVKRTKVGLDHSVNVQKASNENTLEQNRLELERLTAIDLPEVGV